MRKFTLLLQSALETLFIQLTTYVISLHTDRLKKEENKTENTNLFLFHSIYFK